MKCWNDYTFTTANSMIMLSKYHTSNPSEQNVPVIVVVVTTAAFASATAIPSNNLVTKSMTTEIEHLETFVDDQAMNEHNLQSFLRLK